MDVITYPCWDWSENMLVKGAKGIDDAVALILCIHDVY